MKMIHINIIDRCIITSEYSTSSLNSSKTCVIFIYLLLNRGKFVNRSYFFNQFWPDSTESKARLSLRVAIHQIRNFIGDTNGIRLHSNGDQIALDFDSDSCSVNFFKILDLIENTHSIQNSDSVINNISFDWLPVWYHHILNEWRTSFESRVINFLRKAIEMNASLPVESFKIIVKMMETYSSSIDFQHLFTLFISSNFDRILHLFENGKIFRDKSSISHEYLIFLLNNPSVLDYIRSYSPIFSNFDKYSRNISDIFSFLKSDKEIFYIAGPKYSGKTSLVYYLLTHPELFRLFPSVEVGIKVRTSSNLMLSILDDLDIDTVKTFLGSFGPEYKRKIIICRSIASENSLSTTIRSGDSILLQNIESKESNEITSIKFFSQNLNFDRNIASFISYITHDYFGITCDLIRRFDRYSLMDFVKLYYLPFSEDKSLANEELDIINRDFITTPPYRHETNVSELLQGISLFSHSFEWSNLEKIIDRSIKQHEIDKVFNTGLIFPVNNQLTGINPIIRLIISNTNYPSEFVNRYISIFTISPISIQTYWASEKDRKVFQNSYLSNVIQSLIYIVFYYGIDDNIIRSFNRIVQILLFSNQILLCREIAECLDKLRNTNQFSRTLERFLIFSEKGPDTFLSHYENADPGTSGDMYDILTLSRHLWAKGDIPNARFTYLQYFHWAKASNNEVEIFDLINLGSIYSRFGENSRAFDLYRSAVDRSIKEDKEDLLCISLAHLAHASLLEGNTSHSVELFNRSETICIKMGYRYILDRIQYFKLHIYTEQNKQHLAIETFKAISQTHSKLGDYTSVILGAERLCKCLIQTDISLATRLLGFSQIHRERYNVISTDLEIHLTNILKSYVSRNNINFEIDFILGKSVSMYECDALFK